MNDTWPELPFAAWRDTHATLHRWLQIVGKVRLTQMPWINHSWHVSLYVTACGLTTLAVPHGTKSFQIDLDFIEHRLTLVAGTRTAAMPLEAQSVARFYRRLMDLLGKAGVPVEIRAQPNELEDAEPFEADEAHRAYDAEYANRFWRVLAQAERVMQVFRARFRGKSSPVHFFFGNMDLALTRFSGRLAPEHPGGRPHLPDRVLRDAYSDECSECGFWPGGNDHPEPVFYSLAYPVPPGYTKARVRPDAAAYSEALKEFILPYEVVRTARDPDALLLEFLQSTYEAAADLGGWDRARLEPGFRPARRGPARIAR